MTFICLKHRLDRAFGDSLAAVPAQKAATRESLTRIGAIQAGIGRLLSPFWRGALVRSFRFQRAAVTD